MLADRKLENVINAADIFLYFFISLITRNIYNCCQLPSSNHATPGQKPVNLIVNISLFFSSVYDVTKSSMSLSKYATQWGKHIQIWEASEIPPLFLFFVDDLFPVEIMGFSLLYGRSSTQASSKFSRSQKIDCSIFWHMYNLPVNINDFLGTLWTLVDCGYAKVAINLVKFVISDNIME